jgi:hypothetical protein
MPEIWVLSRSTGKRVIGWMPDLPAVSAAQLSGLADAKRGDDADAGDGDDGSAEVILQIGHVLS